LSKLIGKVFTARRVCTARTMPWQDVCPIESCTRMKMSGNCGITAVMDALNVEHRGVYGDGDRLHGSTAGAVLLFAVTPR